jgi:hypothetical protein
LPVARTADCVADIIAVCAQTEPIMTET